MCCMRRRARRVPGSALVDLMLACRTWTQGGARPKPAMGWLPALLLAPSHEAEK